MEISAFVTPYGLFQYKVMSFGIRNAPATFQCFINQVTAEVEGCEVTMQLFTVIIGVTTLNN